MSIKSSLGMPMAKVAPVNTIQVRETKTTKVMMADDKEAAEAHAVPIVREQTIRPPSLFGRSSKGPLVDLHDLAPLQFSRRFTGGLRADIMRRSKFYKSDWLDALTAKNRGKSLASICFLFFACLSPAVTFGMAFAEATGGQLGVVETILSSGISGVLYALFSGQPLCILGATGPELAYTAVFYTLCEAFNIEFLPARVWQGLWASIFTVLISVFDLSALMKHCTRFTEEIFSLLISAIFIVGSLQKVVELYFVDVKSGDFQDDTRCMMSNTTSIPALGSGDSDVADTATGFKSMLDACLDYEKFSRAFLGTLLCFGTYGLALWCRGLPKTTLFLPMVRKILANYGVTISIFLFTFINMGLDNIGMSTLGVPDTIRPSASDPIGDETSDKARAWIVNPFGIHKTFPVWAIFFTAVPALGLAVLGYLDQNLTSLLINRKDHNLKKPPAYHLDMLVCGVAVYPLCALLGLPFTHAATVRSMAHLNSLMTREEVALPNGKTTTRVTEVIEQRLTHFAVHVLLLLSLVAGPVLKLIPKTVLYGVFLYMGITSLPGIQFFDRLKLWLVWDSKEYPLYSYVERVPYKTIHLFTLFQLLMFCILYGLSVAKTVAVVFPFFIGSLIFVRFGMKKCFDADALAELG